MTNSTRPSKHPFHWLNIVRHLYTNKFTDAFPPRSSDYRHSATPICIHIGIIRTDQDCYCFFWPPVYLRTLPTIEPVHAGVQVTLSILIRHAMGGLNNYRPISSLFLSSCILTSIFPTMSLAWEHAGQLPTIPAPPGEVSNFNTTVSLHLYDDLTQSVCLTIATVLIFIRIWTKWRILNVCGWDDCEFLQ